MFIDQKEDVTADEIAKQASFIILEVQIGT
jgi:hypothetical protein